MAHSLQPKNINSLSDHSMKLSPPLFESLPPKYFSSQTKALFLKSPSPQINNWIPVRSHHNRRFADLFSLLSSMPLFMKGIMLFSLIIMMSSILVKHTLLLKQTVFFRLYFMLVYLLHCFHPFFQNYVDFLHGLLETLVFLLLPLQLKSFSMRFYPFSSPSLDIDRTTNSPISSQSWTAIILLRFHRVYDRPSISFIFDTFLA